MGLKKTIKKLMKKQLKKYNKLNSASEKTNARMICKIHRRMKKHQSKMLRYMENLFMTQVDYPLDDFSAIAYIDGSYNDQAMVGAIAIVFLTRSEVKQCVEIPEDFASCGYASTAYELLAAAKAIEMAKKRHIKNLIIKHDNSSVSEMGKKKYQPQTNVDAWYKELIIKFREKHSLTFKKVRGHSLEYFNVMADLLARKALRAEVARRKSLGLTFTLGDKLKTVMENSK